MEKKYPKYPILIVDDETSILSTSTFALKLCGINNVITCSDSREVLELLSIHPFGIVFLDINMPYVNGLELLEKITRDFPQITIIMLTGLDDASTAIECMKKGVFDYIIKPVDKNRLTTCINKAIEHRNIFEETERLKRIVFDDSLQNPSVFENIITSDENMIKIFKYIEAIAPTMRPVLLTGETGVGKELFAKAIHLASGLSGEFVCVNCAGVDDHMFSDTLFGHTKGAFTGAGTEREGLIKTAQNGTLFLDEIGDMKPESQVKLLRLLQDGTYYQVGSDVPQKAKTRFIAATNVDLQEAQEKGIFRKDLYYRLQPHHIHIPSFRERKGDIPLLTEYYLIQASEEMKKKKPTVPPELAVVLDNYDFPGNVRELQGMVYNAVSLHKGGILSCNSFKDAIKKQCKSFSGLDTPKEESNELKFPHTLPTVKKVEEALVAEALKRTRGNKSLAASMIGMDRKTFRKKIAKDLS